MLYWEQGLVDWSLLLWCIKFIAFANWFVSVCHVLNMCGEELIYVALLGWHAQHFAQKLHHCVSGWNTLLAERLILLAFWANKLAQKQQSHYIFLTMTPFELGFSSFLNASIS